MFKNFEKNFYFCLNNHFDKDCSVLYANLLETEPDNSIILYLLSHSYYLKSDFENANFYLNKAKILNSNIDFKDDFSNVNEIRVLAYKTICAHDNPYKNTSAEKAFTLDSVYDSTYINVSNAYFNDNDLSNTISVCKRGLEIFPDNNDLKYNLATAFLKSREIQYAWEGYETRIKLFKHHSLMFNNIPKFNFQKDKAKVCVFATSASENTILFARFLSMLKMHGVNVISKPQQSLVSLFQSSRLDAQSEEISPVDIDYQIPFMSLASLFKIGISGMYNNSKYIFADKKLVNFYRHKLFDTPKSSIGIVWRSNESGTRTIELEKFLPLFKQRNYFNFYSLQKDVTPQEQELLDCYNIKNISEYINDFSDAAALIENMDYIIGCDTALTNLSCAMGKKTYVLLPLVSEWRWGMYEEKTNWYKSAVLLRQKNRGDWDEVISRLVNKLVYVPKAVLVEL